MSAPPIPTWFAGILYRSRLEARYAKFFTVLGIPFEYETQGFKAGSAYLPDFVIFAALGTLWAEVKPAWDADPDGVARFRQFAARRPNPAKSRAALLVGVPTEGKPALVIGGWDDSSPLHGIWEDDGYEWRPCPSGRHFDLTHPGTFGSKLAEDGCPPDTAWFVGEDAIASAMSAAKSERFRSQGPRGTGTAA